MNITRKERNEIHKALVLAFDNLDTALMPDYTIGSDEDILNLDKEMVETSVYQMIELMENTIDRFNSEI